MYPSCDNIYKRCHPTPILPLHPYTHDSISGLRELQEKEIEYFAPLLQGLSAPQTLLVLALEVIPATVILLPGGQGGLSRSFALYCQGLVDVLEPGARVPPVRALAIYDASYMTFHTEFTLCVSMI